MKATLRILKKVGLTLTAVIGALVLSLLILIGIWYVRPNRSVIDPSLKMETWDAVADGTHNSNTDMIYWKGAFFMVHATSPFHFASSQSRLKVQRSFDARNWETVATFDASGEDIRDPKFAVIKDQLFLYALKNTDFTAEPHDTVAAFSQDGLTWSPFQNMSEDSRGWLFWRPKTLDGQTWYVPAYWSGHNRSALLTSTDGLNWQMTAQIYSGDRNDETDIEFLPDGRMIGTARLEFSDSYTGDPRGSTLITLASPPYTEWKAQVKDPLTRLDGPNLFSYHGRIYAVGRFQPVTSGPFAYPGSILATRRTSLFEVRPDRLVYLSDLPSAGDTSYSGLVARGDDLFICYYTSDVHHDFGWILGMVSPSNIRMAHLSLVNLEALANTK